MTRYVVLLTEDDHFAKWDAADDDQRERDFACYRAFSAAVAQRGSIVAGEALTAPGTARTRRPDGTVTDGPFAETVEQLGGFYVIDVPDLDSAVELAGLLPAAYTIEVRECLDVDVS